jgi:plastocyanin
MTRRRVPKRIRFAASGAAVLVACAALLVGLVGQPAQARPAASITVRISGYMFAPNPLAVHVGDTITWTNEDPAPHDITSLSGPTRIGSPKVSKGQSFTWTATTPGTYRYYCSIHPDMKAALTVTAAAVAAPAPVVTRRAPAPVGPGTTTAPHHHAALAPAIGTAATPPMAAAVKQAPVAAPETKYAQTPVATTQRSMDPSLLLVALSAGAVVVALLVLGRRTITQT